MTTTARKTEPIVAIRLGIIPLAGIFILMLCLHFYPTGIDWEGTFSRLDEYWRDPFLLGSFMNPPWIIALLPHAILPLRWGNAVNLILNITMILLVIRKYGGNWKSILLVFSSPFVLDLARTNNIDWIPMLATLLPPAYGLPLLAIKPQAIGGIALIWFKKARWRLLIPLGVVCLLSFLVWGPWIFRYHAGTAMPWNFAPFPYFVPLGIYLLVRAWKSDDEILAAAATPFLVPYFAPYSLTSLLALLVSRKPKAGFYLWCAAWFYCIIETRRIALM